MSAPQIAEVKTPPEEAVPTPGGLRGRWQKLKRSRKFKRNAFVAVGVPLLFVAASWVHHLMVTEETDDAFVTARVHAVGSRIAGTVIEVLVEEHQHVKKGQVLARLDARDYDAQLKIAQANYIHANRDLARWGGAKNLQPYDQLVNNKDVASALTAEAALDQAKLRLEWTEIIAPEDGTIGTRSVETGESVQPGQALFSLVEDNPWIVANFKEGQVAYIRPGQEVEIDVDAAPGYQFKGKVENVAPGSGATFALLPPDNATGNFTKVVQRIPVRILFEPESMRGFRGKLSAGMSSVVTVRVK